MRDRSSGSEYTQRSSRPKLDVHIIVDNYATHSAPTIKRWLANNPRFHFHFIPTHSSWLNQVEVITQKSWR